MIFDQIYKISRVAAEFVKIEFTEQPLLSNFDITGCDSLL